MSATDTYVVKKVMIGIVILLCVVSVYFLYIYSQKGSDVVPVTENSATAKELRGQVIQWEERIKEIGPKDAYQEFSSEAQGVPISTHDQAHAFGEALYATEGLPGLAYCDSSFEFGCYHSFFGVAVAEKGIGVLPEFSESCKRAFGDFNLPCEHGIGHGILVYTDYDKLTDALNLCATISDRMTGGCTSGVFMEYNFHTMDGNTVGYLRPETDNLYEPCDTLPSQFQPSCYLEQVQWWQSIFSDDFAHIGTLCGALPEGSENYAECFHGVGNYVAAFVDLKPEGVTQQCAQMPSKDAQALRHEGASWLIRGDGSGIEDAKMVCEALDSNAEESCLQML